jgi:hypothetical protein
LGSHEMHAAGLARGGQRLRVAARAGSRDSVELP